MAKVMRIVEPHMYEEFLTYLQRPACTCSSQDKPTEQKDEPTFSSSTANSAEDKIQDNTEKELEIKAGEQTLPGYNDKATVCTTESETGSHSVTKNEERVPNPKPLVGGRPTNWLNIEMLHMSPYTKRKYKVKPRKVMKGGKRR